jgi:hypothetical protein
LSLRTHALHCIHHLGLLRQKCVSQIRHPLDIASHPLYHVWILYQRQDARVPRLLCHGVRERFALQILIVIHPLLKLHHFQGISRSSQSLRQKRIWIKSDRCDERIQLLRCECSCLLIVRCGCHLLRLRLLRECGGAQRETNDDYHAMK